MKSFRKELSIEIPSRMAFLNLTPQVQSALQQSGIRKGAGPGEFDEHLVERLHR